MRGTKADLFGYAKVRKTERALIVEYRATITEVCSALGAANYEQAIKIAGLPDLIRGYEHIKLDNVKKYQTQLDEALKEFEHMSAGLIQ